MGLNPDTIAPDDFIFTITYYEQQKFQIKLKTHKRKYMKFA